MYRYFPYLFFLFLSPSIIFGQGEEIAWIVTLAEEIVEETDLCESCTWVNPTISKVYSGNRINYFLRYSCSISESVSIMYDEAGNELGECITRGGSSTCEGFDAFTVYTFSDSTSALWNCTTGFECSFALENDVLQEVPIFIDDSRCVEGIKILKVSEDFQTYNWAGDNIMSNQSSILVEEGGEYSVTVTDINGCIIEGAVNIPDISKLNVNIKGADKFCINTESELKTTNFVSYRWSTGSTTPQIMITEAGTYSITVTNEQDCEGTSSFFIDHFNPAELTITADKTSITEGETIAASFETSSNTPSITSYEWSGMGSLSCATCETTAYTPINSSNLQLFTIDENGCETSNYLTINVEELPLSLYAPNIIRLSSLDLNNKFNILGGVNLQTIEYLRIFDRWGNLVYHNNNFLASRMQGGWNGHINGSIANEGVYLFIAKVIFINGKTEQIEGDFLLLH